MSEHEKDIQGADAAAVDTARSAEAVPQLSHDVLGYDCAIRLAAISTAALSNTRGSAAYRIVSDHPAYTAAYGDVCRAVDREMALREQVAMLRTALTGMVDWFECRRKRAPLEQARKVLTQIGSGTE